MSLSSCSSCEPGVNRWIIVMTSVFNTTLSFHFRLMRRSCFFATTVHIVHSAVVPEVSAIVSVAADKRQKHKLSTKMDSNSTNGSRSKLVILLYGAHGSALERPRYLKQLFTSDLQRSVNKPRHKENKSRRYQR